MFPEGIDLISGSIGVVYSLVIAVYYDRNNALAGTKLASCKTIENALGDRVE
jgi:hypothetical protein